MTLLDYQKSLNHIYWGIDRSTPTFERMCMLREAIKFTQLQAEELALSTDSEHKDLKHWASALADMLHQIDGVAIGNIQELEREKEKESAT